jgi:hypothetical protein
MALKITPIKFLRSLVYNKRPDPSKLLGGQPAVNTNGDQPGLFFRDTYDELVKIGPCAVGEYAPNSASDPNGAGNNTNSRGELWLDESAALGPTLKVYDGSAWKKAEPLIYARVLVSATTPNAAALDLPQGTLWWNSENGLMYILFGDDPDGLWVQIGASATSV